MLLLSVVVVVAMLDFDQARPTWSEVIAFVVMDDTGGVCVCVRMAPNTSVDSY